MVKLSTVKAIAAACTFVTGLSGLLVFLIKKFKKDTLALVIGYTNAFGSGVIIGVGLLHMLAESNELLEHAFPNYPMSFLFAGIGFAIIYLFEDVLLGELVLRHGQEMRHGGLVPHSHGYTDNHNDHDCETGNPASASGAFCFAATGDTIQGNSAQSVDENSDRIGKSQGKRNENADVGGSSPPDDALEVPVRSDDTLPAQHNKPSSLRTTFFALTLLGSISVHAFFAGLGLGVVATLDTLWPTFAAIVLHKGVEAFVVGNAFMNSTLKPKIVGLLLVLFALVTPLGIVIGLGISEITESVETIDGSLVSVSAGTFLYIGTLIIKEGAQPDCPLPRLFNWYRFGLWLFGFAIMAVVAVWA